MNELIAAAVRMCNAVAAHYEALTLPAKPEPPTLVGIDASGPVAPAEPKARKPRATKAEMEARTPAAPAAPAAPVVPEAPVALDEKGSEDRLKVVGEAFVQRFSKQGDAVAEVSKLLVEKYKLARLRDLNHTQRIDLIGILEARIKEIDSRPAVAAVAAPAGLGI